MAIKKAKTKKPTATQRERKRVRQFITRAEKRGYIFDEEFKASLKTVKYQTLKSYTPEKLYKKAEYLILRNTEQYGAGEIISGKAGRRLERKLAAEKGRITRLTKNQQKQAQLLIDQIDRSLSDVFLDRKDLPEEMRKTIDEIEEMLDSGNTIHFSDIERIQSVAHQAFEYSRGYESDYLNEPLDEDKVWRDLTDEDYKVYGQVMEMLENTSGKGKDILEKIIANAISQFGEEEVIKTLGDMGESDIADMQFAINYETDINGGRVFSKIAKRLYSVTGARISNEMNREIGRAMDTM